MIGLQELAADRVRVAVERRRTLGPDGGEVAAEHRRHQLELGHLGHRGHGDGAPVAHDRHPVADRIELVELVADEDHRHALALELADDVEQDGDLMLVERAGGFVHDHQLGLERDGARDRHHLLDGGVEAHQRAMHVDRDVEPAQDLGSLAVHAAPVEQAEAAMLAAEEDVLGHRAIGDEVDLLVDRADPVTLRLVGRAHRRTAGRRR